MAISGHEHHMHMIMHIVTVYETRNIHAERAIRRCFIHCGRPSSINAYSSVRAVGARIVIALF